MKNTAEKMKSSTSILTSYHEARVLQIFCQQEGIIPLSIISCRLRLCPFMFSLQDSPRFACISATAYKIVLQGCVSQRLAVS